MNMTPASGAFDFHEQSSSSGALFFHYMAPAPASVRFNTLIFYLSWCVSSCLTIIASTKLTEYMGRLCW